MPDARHICQSEGPALPTARVDTRSSGIMARMVIAEFIREARSGVTLASFSEDDFQYMVIDSS